MSTAEGRESQSHGTEQVSGAVLAETQEPPRKPSPWGSGQFQWQKVRGLGPVPSFSESPFTPSVLWSELLSATPSA